MTTERATWMDSRSSERGELDVLAGNEVAPGLAGVAEAAVTLVEAIVEKAVNLAGKGGCLALAAVGADVAAERVLHGVSLVRGGIPRGWWLKVQWMQLLTGLGSGKYVHPLGLR